MTTYFASQGEVGNLLAAREGSRTFLPGPTDRLPWVEAAGDPADPVALAEPRAAQSAKGFFLPAAESLGRYGQAAGGETATAVQTRELFLVGVRACELRARNYLDQVMLHGQFEDPLYQQRRQSTTIVSCDCVSCTDSCFCTMVGGLPYPTEGYDVNLTAMDDGFLVDVATERGQQWVGNRLSGSAEATDEQIARRDALRKQVVDRLNEQNAAFGFSASDESQPQLPDDADGSWQRFAADCVECGACTNICPTCHCFYLYDQALGPEEFERVRTWDSCLLSTYHRMAGGVHMKLTPRPTLSSRLANRVLHKFTYSPEQYKLLGCVGCGRCVDACLGAIDIRRVVQELGQ